MNSDTFVLEPIMITQTLYPQSYLNISDIDC